MSIDKGNISTSASLLQHRPILECKCEVITKYFIIRLPRTTNQHDLIMVGVDKLSKATHFIPVNSTFKAIHIA